MAIRKKRRSYDREIYLTLDIVRAVFLVLCTVSLVMTILAAAGIIDRSFIRSAAGYMVCIMLPFMLLIVGEIVRFMYAKQHGNDTSAAQNNVTRPVAIPRQPIPPSVRPKNDTTPKRPQ